MDAAPPQTPSRRGRLVGPLVAVGLLSLAVGVTIGWRVAGDEGSRAERDVGFVVDMLDHHEQAIQLAQFVLGSSDNPQVQSLAQAIVADQRYEIGWMEGWLDTGGVARPGQDRTVMGWMAMPVPFEEMPGRIPDDEIIAFYNAQGADIDRRFLELMIEHHSGGAHMATWAAESAIDPEIRSLARRMAAAQRREVNDMIQMLS